MTNQRSRAVLIYAGYPVAVAYTAARGGRVVSYGFDMLDECLHEVGKAKITRARKYLDDEQLMYGLPSGFVNDGGGGEY